MINKRNRVNATEECYGGCSHTDEEHDAFDGGISAGRAGFSQEVCPHKETSLREAWLAGLSVGQDDNEV